MKSHKNNKRFNYAWKIFRDIRDKKENIDKIESENEKIDNLIREISTSFNQSNTLNRIGMDLFEKKQYIKAVSFFQKAIKQFPENSSALFNLGECYLSLSKYDESIECFKQILYKFPEHIPAKNRIAYALWKKKEFEGARQIYLAILNLAPDQRGVLLDLGRLSMDMHRYNEGIKCMQRVSEIKSTAE